MTLSHLLLVRLGLRPGAIVTMRLDGIEWIHGTIRVRGKSRREVRLPLPQEAGDALLTYLEKGRPQVPMNRVFLCSTAPFRPLTNNRALVRRSSRLATTRLAINFMTAPTTTHSMPKIRSRRWTAAQQRMSTMAKVAA
jgi:integrase